MSTTRFSLNKRALVSSNKASRKPRHTIAAGPPSKLQSQGEIPAPGLRSQPHSTYRPNDLLSGATAQHSQHTDTSNGDALSEITGNTPSQAHTRSQRTLKPNVLGHGESVGLPVEDDIAQSILSRVMEAGGVQQLWEQLGDEGTCLAGNQGSCCRLGC
jgi:hypothetical protein